MKHDLCSPSHCGHDPRHVTSVFLLIVTRPEEARGARLVPDKLPGARAVKEGAPAAWDDCGGPEALLTYVLTYLLADLTY